MKHEHNTCGLVCRTLLGDLSLVLSVAGREPQHGETTKAVACSFPALRPGQGGGAASPSAELASLLNPLGSFWDCCFDPQQFHLEGALQVELFR